MRERDKERKRKHKWMLFNFVSFTLITAFLYGHISAVINEYGQSLEFVVQAIEHIKTSPLDVFHVNAVAAYFTVGIYIIGLVMLLTKSDKVRGDMKNEEHGSNDFQTAEETVEFLKKNTTEIMELDLRAVHPQ